MTISAPNPEQLKSLIRLLLGAGGPVAGLLVSRGMASSTVEDILSLSLIIIPPLISLVWSMFTHTDANAQAVVAAQPIAAKAALGVVSAIPGITGIVVAPNATGIAAAAVADPELPKVVTVAS